MPSARTATSRDASGGPRGMTLAVLLLSFMVYALTISRGWWTTDVFGANWTSWHIAATGSPWIDGTRIPEVGHRSNALLAIVHTDNGHTAFGRFPGVVAASLPAYLIAGSARMTTVPGSLTAALLTACALALMFNALRRRLTNRSALVAVGVLGFATPAWTVSANLMWPHTITVLGIAGMAWASSSNRWWWAGVFGGIAIWGRIHTAIIVGLLGLGVGLRRRDPRVVLRVGVASGLFLVASTAWIHWEYGTWNPLGAYDGGTVGANADQYRYSLTNQLGTWIAPDRGVLVWTPIALLLLPALARSWQSLPDWSRALLVGGLVYTVVGGAMNTFTGGDGFYGYRYALELTASATPALAFSSERMGRVARVLIGPVGGVQFFAFLLGAVQDQASLPQSVAWHENAFVHAMQAVGPIGWGSVGLAALVGLVGARLLSGKGRLPGMKPDPTGRTEDQVSA